jgi:ribonucleotide reductase beta subunit family protein with ferritin-like domain
MVRVLFFEDGSHTTWHFENLELLEDMKDWIPLMSESNQEGLKELL